MKLKNKVTIVCIIITITAIAVSVFSFNKIFHEDRDDYLNSFTEKKITVINNYFEYSSKELTNILSDNAYWDDFFYNLQEKNIKWIRRNVSKYLYDKHEFYIDIVFLENSYSDINEIYGDNITIEDIKATDIYKKTLIENKINQDYIEINNKVYIIVASPVSTDNGEKSNGILILAREINKDYLLQLHKFLLYDNINEINFINNYNVNKSFTIYEDSVDIFYPIKGNNNVNLLWLKLNFNIQLFQNMLNKILIRIIFIIVICIILSALIFYIYIKINMNKIYNIIKQTRNISQGNYEIKLLETGDQEFKELAESVNKMSYDIKKVIEEQEKSYLEAIKSLVVTLEMKDPYTKGHSVRVAYYTYFLGKELNYKDLENLYNAALVHDIGKISIPDNILNKPSKLTYEEYELIKGHSINGFKILQASKIYSNIKYIIKYHHERIDGKGYPDELSNTNIPFGARILSVADVFDALTSERSYRKPMEIKDAIQVVVNGRNAQFDSKVIDIFKKNIYKIYHKGIETDFKIDF